MSEPLHTESEALTVLPAFNNHRLERLHQLPLLLGVRANANITNHQARVALMGQYTMAVGTLIGGILPYMDP